uniref:G_PROTEIN_RECEP_F1_2 domain-containing protein n=1 Tax=Angiostrongylus cantonensis TaxID=6313 RepID=A0A0K0DL88_ANGCA
MEENSPLYDYHLLLLHAQTVLVKMIISVALIGKWRCHSNYLKLIIGFIVLTAFWSIVPTIGYGKYSTFHGNTFCSLDWRQGDFDSNSPESTEAAHHYIAFLTATCLIFFLIPVCIASSFYYSIIDHVDRLNSTEARKENESTETDCYYWAPKGNVAKVGLGCLLVSTVPFLAYSIVCLNPMKSDFNNASYIVVPVIISRICPLLNPLLYIWCNPCLVPINEFIEKQAAKRRPPQKTYHAINAIARVSGMSFPILTPAVPRRQLPKIPPNLTSPKRSHFNEAHESTPMLH